MAGKMGEPVTDIPAAGIGRGGGPRAVLSEAGARASHQGFPREVRVYRRHIRAQHCQIGPWLSHGHGRLHYPPERHVMTRSDERLLTPPSEAETAKQVASL